MSRLSLQRILAIHSTQERVKELATVLEALLVELGCEGRGIRAVKEFHRKYRFRRVKRSDVVDAMEIRNWLVHVFDEKTNLPNPVPTASQERFAADMLTRTIHEVVVYATEARREEVLGGSARQFGDTGNTTKPEVRRHVDRRPAATSQEQRSDVDNTDTHAPPAPDVPSAKLIAAAAAIIFVLIALAIPEKESPKSTAARQPQSAWPTRRASPSPMNDEEDMREAMRHPLSDTSKPAGDKTIEGGTSDNVDHVASSAYGRGGTFPWNKAQDESELKGVRRTAVESATAATTINSAATGERTRDNKGRTKSKENKPGEEPSGINESVVLPWIQPSKDALPQLEDRLKFAKSGELPKGWSGSPHVILRQSGQKRWLQTNREGVHSVSSPELHISGDFTFQVQALLQKGGDLKVTLHTADGRTGPPLRIKGENGNSSSWDITFGDGPPFPYDLPWRQTGFGENPVGMQIEVVRDGSVYRATINKLGTPPVRAEQVVPVNKVTLSLSGFAGEYVGRGVAIYAVSLKPRSGKVADATSEKGTAKHKTPTRPSGR